ncbi:MAG: aminotransferase class I/II-fold pyridoxal phosphate-dependent enzyme, partial [Candidatus Eisenbacteria bacterium]|nr:aminotransferase class I/II-fold pyridoxal phosphate-dependent enzyme [Candidatus Eisenbacteria bacterium]
YAITGSGDPRAPMNAIQLITPASATPPPALGIAKTATSLSITFTGKLQTAPAVTGPWTKTYAMTGWRLGYGIMNETLAKHVARLQTNCTSCTCSFTQRAGIAGITGPQDDSMKMVREFKKRRDVVVRGLNSIKGVSCKTPRGAFYVFPNVKATGMDCDVLASRLLEEKGVALLSGTAFGKYGKGYLRLSYANSIENINKGLSRMKEFIEKL